MAFYGIDHGSWEFIRIHGSQKRTGTCGSGQGAFCGVVVTSSSSGIGGPAILGCSMVQPVTWVVLQTQMG